MIKIIPNLIPNDNFGIAFSGGIDSVVFSHFLKQGRKKFSLYFFNHGDESDIKALEFSKKWAEILDVPFYTNQEINPLKATENTWRTARYNWLESLDIPIITGHNFEDVVSGYVMFWIKGQEKFIPVERNNIRRPFLLTSKDSIHLYAQKHNLQWYEEPYNSDLSYNRVRVNLKLLPEIYEINPNFNGKVNKLFIEKLKKENYL